MTAALLYNPSDLYISNLLAEPAKGEDFRRSLPACKIFLGNGEDTAAHVVRDIRLLDEPIMRVEVISNNFQGIQGAMFFDPLGGARILAVDALLGRGYTAYKLLLDVLSALGVPRQLVIEADSDARTSIYAIVFTRERGSWHLA